MFNAKCPLCYGWDTKFLYEEFDGWDIEVWYCYDCDYEFDVYY